MNKIKAERDLLNGYMVRHVEMAPNKFLYMNQKGDIIMVNPRGLSSTFNLNGYGLTGEWQRVNGPKPPNIIQQENTTKFAQVEYREVVRAKVSSFQELVSLVSRGAIFVKFAEYGVATATVAYPCIKQVKDNLYINNEPIGLWAGYYLKSNFYNF